MKKSTVFSGFIFLLLFAVIIAGCSKQRVENQVDKPNNLALLNKLSDFNKSRLNANGNMLKGKCSGFWNCLAYAASVAGADIVGAAGGVMAVKEVAGAFGLATGGTGAAVVMGTAGVIAGAGASYVAAYAVVADTPNVHKYGDLTIDPSQFSYLASTGIEHNTVLHNNFYNGAPFEEYYSMKGLTDIEKRVIESDAMREAASKINVASEEYALNGFDFRKLTQRLVNDNLINPDIKNVLDLFLEVYVVCEEEEEMEAVINFYMNEVVNSSLTDDNKEALVVSFMVASQSPFYFLDNF